MRNLNRWSCLLCLVALLAVFCLGCGNSASGATSEQIQGQSGFIFLPEPEQDGKVSIEETLSLRRSTRSYTDEALTLKEVSQLLWAAQGITDASGHRTAPSAGALYPLYIYIVVGNVTELMSGVYEYDPVEHKITRMMDGDIRDELAGAAMSQSSIRTGAVSIVLTADYDKTTDIYGERGVMYVHLEAGHAAQNVCLQATALDLGLVTAGTFSPSQVSVVMNLPEDRQPLYIIPVGRKQ